MLEDWVGGTSGGWRPCRYISDRLDPHGRRSGLTRNEGEAMPAENWKTALRASGCALNRQRASSSHSSVANKFSHMALSYASPTEPVVEGFYNPRRRRAPRSDISRRSQSRRTPTRRCAEAEAGRRR